MRRSVVASVLAIVVLSVTILPAAAAPTDEPVTVTLNATAGSYDAGTTYEFDLVVENTSGSVGAYDIDLTASERLTMVSYEPVNPLGEFGSISISSDGTTANLTAADAGVQSQNGVATLGTLTVRPEANGTATITPALSELVNETGSQYTNATVRTLSFSVGSETSSFTAFPGASGPPTSIDADPLLEDIDGDGSGTLFDALAYYNNRNSPTIQNNPTEFDFDGDGTAGTLFDALALYNKISE